MRPLLELDAVVDDHTGLSRTVLDYTLEMNRIIDAAKTPGFDARVGTRSLGMSRPMSS